ncbi:glycosyltransferase family 4 protein [Sphingobium sp.]|uniref:glycosyltransferase family 4 protein n=1 Tax=Sphingobium sp. TaxID=1912891 RepID=UPI003BB4A707
MTYQTAASGNAPAQSVPASSGRIVMVVGARGIPGVEGGAEKNAEMLFPIAAAAGYRVVLLGLSGLMKDGNYRGVELRAAPNRRIFNTDKLFYYIHALGVARRLKPDIVHLQGLGASLFLLAYKAMGAKTVVRYGSADYLVSKWGWIGRAGFRLAEFQTRFADAVIAVAPSLASRLARKGIASNVHIIANALDEAQPSGNHYPEAAKGDTPFILAVGRVTAQKNVHSMIAGFNRFRENTGSNHRLLIAGGLDEIRYVESLAPLMTDHVTLLGRCSREQLNTLYKDCALYINGSVHEGSSNAVLEAVSRECPIVLSGIPENRDFPVDDLVFFDPLDPDAIARTMEAALRDPDHYRADRSRFMNWSSVGAKTLEIYRKILA